MSAELRGAPETGESPVRSAQSYPPLPDDALIVVPVRNIVLFPGMVFPITVGRPKSIAAAQQAVRDQKQVGILLQREHQTVFDKTTLDLSVSDVWFPSENVALVDGGYEITGIHTPWGEALPARRGHLTSVLIKENGKWWIAASRSSIPVTLPYREPQQ